MHQSCAHHLGRVNDAALSQVHILTSCSIETLLDVALFQHLSNHQVALETCVLSYCDGRDLDGALNDADTCNFAFSQAGVAGKGVQAFGGVEKGSTSSWDNTFSDGSSGGAEGIGDSVLDFSNFDLTGSSDFDDSDSSF